MIINNEKHEILIIYMNLKMLVGVLAFEFSLSMDRDHSKGIPTRLLNTSSANTSSIALTNYYFII